MKFTKRHLLYLLIVIAVAFFLSAYKLPYYIYKPGGADPLNPIVSVEGGYKSAGDMHLVTVRGGQATPIQYVFAKLLPHNQVVPLEEVLPKGIDEEEYYHAQLQMMESSQEASTVVAYKAANKEIHITYNGVYVAGVMKGLPADGKLKMGDRITKIDGKGIKKAEELTSYVTSKHGGDTISLTLVRDDKTLTKEITLKNLKELDDKPGVGIQLVTDRNVTVKPKVKFSSGSIGGPSAGLMFSLEIYDQLTKEDLTHGYQIAGTGEIDYDGNVGRIGGIDKKVIAADKEGCKVFFAPNEHGAKNSNYKVAKKTADEIGTSMKIVPVDTFDDALKYLENMK
ncbi:SepM family pheromone-processing serine protease [Lentibacillus sp. L22]|uniref:SepM family pheromone-processing serine protease n=1 Tax=Lentibacillus TaxID=175304 RepID=UPI0022B1885A|nr:SepM family pheromone-processing serine protease [Lentibacillus daqui]